MSDTEQMMQELSEDEFDVNQQLREVYHSPADGYSGVQDLYRKAKERDILITLKQVRNFLKSQDTYTKTFPKGGPFVKKKYRQTIVGKLGQQLQMDLVDMGIGNLGENEDNRYIVSAIEVLSRYAFTAMQKGKSGKDTSVSVIKILDEFKDHFGDYPDLVQFDEGNEFKRPEMAGVFRERDIHTFSTLIRREGYHRIVAKTDKKKDLCSTEKHLL